MSYTVLRGCWCNNIALNVRAPTEETSDDIEDSFYDELEQIFDHFPTSHVKILLGDCNTKLRWEDIFKPTTGDDSLHHDSNDTGVKAVNFDPSNSLAVKSIMFQHHNIHKYNWPSCNRKIYNQIDHVLTDKRWHSSILDVQSFSGADSETDHYLSIAASKQAVQKFDVERLNLKWAAG